MQQEQAIQTISSRSNILAAGTVTIQQRTGRFAVVFSITQAGTIEVYDGVVDNSHMLLAVTNPAYPVTLRLEQFGPVVRNKLVVKNPTGGALDVNITELIRGA